ncbi:MAG: STAS/SEC14 domain-containing protein [Gammaproteobacteria bacterium]
MNDAKAFRLLDFDDAANGILAYAVDDGDLSAEDVKPIWQRFEEANANGTRIRIYAEMAALPTPSGGVIIDKLKHLGAILSAMDRLAVVGDAGWMALYAKIVDPITRFEVKHFTIEQRDEAIAWIKD